ncbi:MAG: hypothetical protein ACE5KU_00165 [Nitrososphaerales archaeon]
MQLKQNTKEMQKKRPPRPMATAMIVMGIFALFTWGFSYNLLKRIGFAEPTAQLSGLTFGLIAVIAIELFTRLRLKHLYG